MGNEISHGIGQSLDREVDLKYGNIAGIDKQVSRLVQGTTMVGSGELDYSFKLLDDVFAMGCNTFDTAHIYGGGDNERTVGRWVNERGIREEVVIIAKGAHLNADRRRVTPFDISSDLFDSLARFKFDYVDLYLLHRDDPSVPVGPIVEALNEHVKAGRIRAFGGSNWTHQRLQEVNDYAKANNLIPFAASSPNFTLAHQLKEPWEGCVTITGTPGKAAREWYAASAMPVFAWSSLAQGFFSGKFTRDNLDSFQDGFDRLCIDCFASEENFKRLDRVKEMAALKKVTTTQLVVAWLLSQKMDVYPLIGCRSGEEFKANHDAMNIKLTPEEAAWLDLE